MASDSDDTPRRYRPDELHTYVASSPHDVREVEKMLEKHVGGTWRTWHAENSGVAGTALSAQYTRAESGRWMLSGLLLLGDALTADKLRGVPVTALENSMNLGDQSAAGFEEELGKLPPLKRTPGMASEDFSRLVAEHYKVWARYVPHPAGAMAAQWKVKDPTVHTWIREARLRGFLPPAKRGKGKST